MLGVDFDQGMIGFFLYRIKLQIYKYKRDKRE
jgi:hypothetical protein